MLCLFGNPSQLALVAFERVLRLSFRTAEARLISDVAIVAAIDEGVAEEKRKGTYSCIQGKWER